MLSKRGLGVSYVLGLGLGLIVTLVGYLVLVERATDLQSIGTVTALGVAGSLPYLGYWLHQSDLSDAAVWTVARWCAVGVAVPTAFAGTLLLGGFRPRLVLMFPHLLANLVALGGVVGAMLGLIRELRRQYARAEQLNRRNSILNYLMRHDIRNDVNVIQGYVEMLADQAGDDDEELIRPVQRKSEAILETSDLARRVQSLDDDAEQTPVNVITLVTECVTGMEEAYPDADITSELPDEAWAAIDDVFQSVINNLIENAIEHNDQTPEISVTVTDDDETVTIRVADNGPGIPERHRAALAADAHPSDADQAGLGLWLVKWAVDQYNGTLRFDDNDPRGTVVTIALPAATPAAADQHPS